MEQEDIALVEWAAALLVSQALNEVNTANRLYVAYSDRDFVHRDLDAARAKMVKAARLTEIAKSLRENE